MGERSNTSVDIALMIFGIILLFVGFKLPYEKEKIDKFWSKDLIKDKK